MKKFFVLLTLLVAAVTLFACAGEENRAPAISGNATDEAIMLGDSFNVILGVHASDVEDGSLDSEIEVSISPDITVNSTGEITPTSKGKFVITYSVTDSDGATTTTSGNLMVTEELLQVPSTSSFRPSTLILLENGMYIGNLGIAGTWTLVDGVFTITPYVGDPSVGGINAETGALEVTIPGAYFPETMSADEATWQAALGDIVTYTIPAIYS